ncbi:MAG: META domain-containing protein, partial [Spirochaetaceae bacterium]|nr:META domain-containing protein [Spirochaetaceae bacterium]
MNIFVKICVLVCLFGITAYANGAAKMEKTPDFTELLGKEWKLASVVKGGDDIGFRRDSLTEDQNGYYTLSFDAQQINGTGAPNRYFSDYQQRAGDLSFGVIAGTKMFAFNEPEKLREHDYFAYLQGTSRWN